MRTSQNPAYRFLKVNKGRSPLRIALPADAVCRKNAQSSLRPKPGSSYEVQHLKNTDHINRIGKCYSKIRVLASKNQGRIPRKPLPPAAFRPSNPCPAPFEPPSPSETIRPFSQKTASRHHDAPLAGTNSRLSSHKKGQAVNTGPPLSVWHMRNAYFSSALSDTSIRRPAVPSGCVSVSTRRYPKEIESG